MLSVQQRNLLIQNASRSPSEVIQEENENMWVPDRLKLNEKNKRKSPMRQYGI